MLDVISCYIDLHYYKDTQLYIFMKHSYTAVTSVTLSISFSCLIQWYMPVKVIYCQIIYFRLVIILSFLKAEAVGEMMNNIITDGVYVAIWWMVGLEIGKTWPAGTTSRQWFICTKHKYCKIIWCSHDMCRFVTWLDQQNKNWSENDFYKMWLTAHELLVKWFQGVMFWPCTMIVESHEGRALSTSLCHYNDIIMSVMASQITSLTIVYSTVYSGADQRKHQSFASLAFVQGIHRWPVNSLHKGPVT